MALIDPRTKYPRISPEAVNQEEPGLESGLNPRAEHGFDTYRGHGRLEGRRAIVTGGDSGIGSAVAVAFAREGADVAITYQPEEQEDADRVEAQVTAAGRKIVLLPGEQKDPHFMAASVDRAAKELGGLDLVVANAGRQITHPSIVDISDEDFDQTMKLNVYGTFYTVRAAIPHLKPGSSIIITTSIQAYQPSPDIIDYAMTKAAVNNLAKGLAQLLGPEGIRVNSVAPGPVWTPMQNSHGKPLDQLPTFGQSAPLGRSGQPAELAGPYVFLASEDASYISGETLSVTGGKLLP